MKKVLAALSGGVDSTVVAYLLRSQGYAVEGVYMRLHKNDAYHEANIQKVARVAAFLDIPYHVLDLEERFDEAVFTPFIAAYEKGLTPNPCVLCNRHIKLGALIDFAKTKGFDALATGHYVQIKEGFIKEAVDESKDQSYFLSHVKKEALDFMMFPLGGMYKSDVKEIARNIDVLKSFAEQKESSEICFVQNSYLEVLANHIDTDRPGDVVDESGKVVGAHRGYMHYTIGKRKGFTVNGAHDPHYVLSIDEGKNQITVGTKEQLDCWRFEVEALVLYIPQNEFECSVKIRYRSPKTPCHVSIHGGIADVVLHQSVQGVAPGQVAVFYEGDKIIASGWIKGATKTSIGENKDESQ